MIYMALKGFNKKLQKSCLWCIHGIKSEYSDDIFCKKHGVTTRADSCRHYKNRLCDKRNAARFNAEKSDILVHQNH